MRWFIFLIPCLCFANTQEIHVSAVVPPRPCDVNEQCEQISKEMKPYIKTSATVTKDTVKYVGSKPKVTTKDGVKTVLF
jgi:hypothetical protein